MKKLTILITVMFVSIFSQAQENVIKLSGLDAAFGVYEVSYERTFNEGMNNIRPSGKIRKQGKWPNILTKGSMQVSLTYINSSLLPICQERLNQKYILIIIYYILIFINL